MEEHPGEQIQDSQITLTFRGILPSRLKAQMSMLYGMILVMETGRFTISALPMEEHPGEQTPGSQIILSNRGILLLQLKAQMSMLYGMTFVMETGRFTISALPMEEHPGEQTPGSQIILPNQGILLLRFQVVMSM